MDLIEAGLPALFQRVFELAEIAEEEILRAGSSKKTESAFALLVPGGLIHYGDELYRAHCRELLIRVKKKEDLRSPTKAEILAALSALSLKRPHDRNTAALQERLFAELFPKKALEGPIQEEWPGACDEILIELRRTLFRKERSQP